MQANLKPHLAAFLISIIATIAVFNGILNGNIVANCAHIYNFEPWLHHSSNLDSTELSNHIFSDSVDGADANLNPTNANPFSISKYLQLNHAISRALKKRFGYYPGSAIDCLIIFTLMMFFMYLYLRLIGINWGVAIAVSIGFTYGGTNMHLHLGWAYETACAVFALYFIERLFQRNTWLDALLACLALVNLGGCPMVHIVVYYCVFLLFYIFSRLTFKCDSRFELLYKFTLLGVGSLLLSLDYLWPTISYFNDNFEKGYRENYGLQQNDPTTLFTFLFANFFGHPRSESTRWISGVYINTGMFIGTITFFSAISAAIVRVIVKRDFYSIFFFIASIFGVLYAYQLPFEHIESYIGILPVLKWAKAIYFKAVLHLFIAILGALGLQYLYSEKSRYKPYITFGCALFSLYVFWQGMLHVDYIKMLNKGSSAYLDWYLPIAYASALVSISLLILIGFKDTFGLGKYRLTSLLSSFALISLVGFETIIHTKGWIPYAKSQHCFPETDTTNFLKSNVGNSRILPLSYAAIPSLISINTYGIETAAGRMMVKLPYLYLLRQADANAYQRHPTQYLFQTNTNLHSPVWDLADVKYFVASPSIDLSSVLATYPVGSIIPHRFKDGTILERNPPPQHAYLISFAKVYSSPEEMAEAVANGIDVRNAIALEDEKDIIPGTLISDGAYPNVTSGSILAFQKSENVFEISYRADQDAYIQLSELYNPSWNAYVGNKKLKTFRSYFFLTGIQVPAGEHTIQMRYELPYSKLTNVIVCFTLICIFFTAIYLCYFKNPS